MLEIIKLPYIKNITNTFEYIAHHPWSIWLDSGITNNRNTYNYNSSIKNINQRYDIVSCFPYKTIQSDLNHITITDFKLDTKQNNINNKVVNINKYNIAQVNIIDLINNLLKNLQDNLDFTKTQPSYRDHGIITSLDPVVKPRDDGILRKSYNHINNKNNFNKNKNLPPFWHGMLGYFGYDLNQILYFNKLRQIKNNKYNIPILSIGLYDWALISDHELKTSYISYDKEHISKKNINIILELLINNNLYKTKTKNNNHTNNIKNLINNIEFKTDIDLNIYSENFKKIKDYIYNGDCYQINYCLPFSSKINSNIYNKSDNKTINYNWQIYKYLKNLNPNPFGCYFNLGNNLSILSYSPERFININNNTVTTSPIKGTRKNIIDNNILNQKNIDDLINSPKDRAENIMITDLMRNDLNKYCVPGSVKTTDICKLHTFPTVHHLISNIQGRIKNDTTAFDLFLGSIPGGSITGAPKLRAMQIIQELENSDNNISRYLYCGNIGYININNNLDMNIAIRTAVINNNYIYYWAGSGIVADSVCEQEYAEVFDKIIKTK